MPLGSRELRVLVLETGSEREADGKKHILYRGSSIRFLSFIIFYMWVDKNPSVWNNTELGMLLGIQDEKSSAYAHRPEYGAKKCVRRKNIFPEISFMQEKHKRHVVI